MAKIFVSHSSSNDAEAVTFVSWLKASGWDNCFFALDGKQYIHPGQRARRLPYPHLTTLLEEETSIIYIRKWDIFRPAKTDMEQVNNLCVNLLEAQ
jgi:hypothetical protein